MKFLKKLIVVLVSLILVVTLTLWVLAETVKPEVVKNYISEQLSLITAQPSHINGKITWQLFPEPGIRITNIEVADANNTAPYQLKIDKLLFNLKLTPLLRGKLVFSEVKIDGFTINANTEKAFDRKQGNTKSSASPQGLKSRFAVKRILLTHGQVNLISHNKTIHLSELQIGTELPESYSTLLPVQLKSAIQILDNQKIEAQSHIQFKGSAVIPPDFLSNPVAKLTDTVLNGQLILEDIQISSFKINRMAGNAVLHNGVFKLSPVTISLYQGESVGDLRYENNSGKLLMNQTASGLNSSTIMNALFQKKILKGKMDFSLHSETDFRSEDWLKNTTGTGVLSIKDGSLESVNLNQAVTINSNKISEMLSAAPSKQKLKPEQFEDSAFFEGNTPFRLLSIHYHLQNTLLTSDSLLLQTDSMHLKGSGSLNMESGVLSSQLGATVLMNKNTRDELQKVLGVNFPIIVTGTIMKPLVLPDFNKINTAITDLWIKETLVKPVHLIRRQLQSMLTPQPLT